MSEHPLTPCTEKSAWTAAELAADPNWNRRLSDDEISELERVSEALISAGKYAPNIRFDDVSSPVLSKLADWIAEELEFGRGCVVLRGLDVDRYERRQVETMYWLLSVLFSTPMHQNPDGEMIAEVTDKGLDYNDPLVRGYKSKQKLLTILSSKTKTAEWLPNKYLNAKLKRLLVKTLRVFV